MSGVTKVASRGGARPLGKQRMVKRVEMRGFKRVRDGEQLVAVVGVSSVIWDLAGMPAGLCKNKEMRKKGEVNYERGRKRES